MEYDLAGATSTGKRKRRAEGAPSEETRGAKYRPTASRDVRDRVDRALTQRLFLVTRDIADGGQRFSVLGSTANVYVVSIDRVPRCTCPDFLHKQQACKHILWVFLKVLKQAPHNPVIWQKALLQSELDEIFAHAPPAAAGVLANDQVRAAFAALTGRPASSGVTDGGGGGGSGGSGSGSAAAKDDEKAAAVEADGGGVASGTNNQGPRPIEQDEQCPICFEDLDPKNPAELTYCRGGCRRSLHSECSQRWLNSLRQKGKELTCVYCRQAWQLIGSSAAASASSAADSPKGVREREGYVNFAELSGQADHRDHSVYSEWSQRVISGRGRRGRW